MKTIFLFLGVVCSMELFAQQVSDTAFVATIQNPKYEPGKGSAIMIDAAHHNFHTLNGRYRPFGKVLQNDGYQLLSNEIPLSQKLLQSCRIYVISNPLDSSNLNGWQLPTPSAFTTTEITALNEWVRSGGRLLLIADHMPFAGAAQALAKSFGFEFSNCFAMDNRRRSLERFYRSNQTLADNEITRGVDTVITFTGSAFRIPKGATPILALKNYSILSPQVAWQFEENTPTIASEGLYQGAYLEYGEGKIVVMGEAAMFTAQLTGPNRVPVGLNRPEARQNAQLLLNIIHWLDK
ncbi:MAG: hypothetical protein ACKVT2_07695 [Saprospiraceae bacterium]